jgi:uncharacterized protein YegL
VNRPESRGLTRRFPFYIVCDASETMWNPEVHTDVAPFEILELAVPELLTKLERRPVVRDAAMVSVISFADSASVVVPLTRPGEVIDMAPLPRGTYTNYHAAFDLLCRIVRSDCERLESTHDLKRPAVFFLTDGRPEVNRERQPESVWAPRRDALVGLRWKPQMVSLGFGRAETESLCRMASAQAGIRLAFLADEAAQVAELLEGIMAAIFLSIGSSVSKGDLIMTTPPGMRLLSCGGGA